MNCLLLFNFPLCLLLFSLFLLPRSLSFAGKMHQEGCSTSHAAGRHLAVSSPSWNASAQLVKLYTPQCAWLLKRLDFAEVVELTSSWHKNMNCYRATVVCLDAKGYGNREEFHFNWVYSISATLSSLQNWANNDRYWLRPSTPAQLCWSSSRLQPLQNCNLIKFALIRPSTLNHDRNLWNFRGAPDETTCFAGFFRCPSALILFLHEIV